MQSSKVVTFTASKDDAAVSGQWNDINEMVQKCHVYEVRDLFPWEILTKMVIQYLSKVEKQWNSAQINLSSTLNFYRKIFFDATISTEI